MEMVEKVMEKVMDLVSIPAMGAEEDIKKAKEIVGDDVNLFAALRAPPEFYELKCMDYCKLATNPFLCCARINANAALKNTLYIVSEKNVKVHLDPYEPPIKIGPLSRDAPEMSIEDIKAVKVIRKGGTCWDPKEKTGLVFEDSGMEFFISDPEKLEAIINKMREAKNKAEGAAAKVEAAQESTPAPDEGQSATPGNA